MTNPECIISSFAQVFVTAWSHGDLSQVLAYCLEVKVFAHDSHM